MTRYSILLNILDSIIAEARATQFEASYNPPVGDVEKLNQARARAFIHLFIKVSFGVLDFTQRERRITDGTQDGGVDGYYIDREQKLVFFIQSKFRTTKENFEGKGIQLEEILVMDVNRMLNGETKDEKGIDYNGKIMGMIREIKETQDIARYHYKIVLLANLSEFPESKLRQLTGGFPVEVVNFEKCYESLVFPVISGTYFNASELSIYIDLSNKNAGNKISYTVNTQCGECEITVLFVPTLEIAKVLNKYKNSILKFNPRSYLELEGKKVNQAIRETVMNTETNEFALFNNGITMVSDETSISEKIGQRNKAQLIVRNPQIINGGQTAYSLSRIYEENGSEGVGLFDDKEVLLKIITLSGATESGATPEQKRHLIDQISSATNLQTQVTTADRHSNEQEFLDIQKTLFLRCGILYERKRGEFQDGLHKGYVSNEIILERNLFFRLYLATVGRITETTKKKLFVQFKNPQQTVSNSEMLDRIYFSYKCYLKLEQQFLKTPRSKQRMLYAKIFGLNRKYFSAQNPPEINEEMLIVFEREWKDFTRELVHSGKYSKKHVDPTTKEESNVFNTSRWIGSQEFEQMIKSRFG